jgi:hypothetical protein
LKRTLAKMVVANLGRALSAGRFDRLVLVAPSTMLGDIRDALADVLRGAALLSGRSALQQISNAAEHKHSTDAQSMTSLPSHIPLG